jgi:hypothetical protein
MYVNVICMLTILFKVLLHSSSSVILYHLKIIRLMRSFNFGRRVEMCDFRWSSEILFHLVSSHVFGWFIITGVFK